MHLIIFDDNVIDFHWWWCSWSVEINLIERGNMTIWCFLVRVTWWRWWERMLRNKRVWWILKLLTIIAGCNVILIIALQLCFVCIFRTIIKWPHCKIILRLIALWVFGSNSHWIWNWWCRLKVLRKSDGRGVGILGDPHFLQFLEELSRKFSGN